MMAGESSMLLNTAAYGTTPLVLLLVGNVAWAIVYITLYRNIHRHATVEIPAAAIASNLAWVTVWGLMYRTDLGTLFVWANRAAILLELGVFTFVLRTGARHIRTPEVKRWFRPGILVSYGCWFIMLYFFSGQKSLAADGAAPQLMYELPSGMISAMIIALYMSILYVVVELSEIEPHQYSLLIGWAKFLGNACGSLFCVLTYPNNHFLLSICAITFLLDAVYLLLFRQRRWLGRRVPEPA